MLKGHIPLFKAECNQPAALGVCASSAIQVKASACPPAALGCIISPNHQP